MIFVRLFGGLGNQMFQFAAGHALSQRLGVELAMDDRLAVHRGNGTLTRVFDLDIAKDADFPPAQHQRKFAYHLWRFLGSNPKHYREPSLGFDPIVPKLPDNTYLHGYWQSEKYFFDFQETLRANFTFPQASGRNLEIANHIAETNSISLHLRRGDYVSNNAYTVCAQPYYDAALAALLPQIKKDPQIFVFSDDPDWARENLKLPGTPVIVDHNGAEHDYEDMRLMSLCKHNIIANSSFSWWGAWLNQNVDRQVIAPKVWFGKETMSNPDIWAQGWTKV